MDNNRYVVQIFVGTLSPHYEALTIEASKQTTAGEIVSCISEKLRLDHSDEYELAEVIGNAGGQVCKERRLGDLENPVAVQMLWPKFLPSRESKETFQAPQYRFCLREKLRETCSTAWPDGVDTQLIRDYFLRFLYQPRDKEYPDLCQLPDLNETTLLENLKARFHSGHIYTYVGSILIAVNPFKFYPIYNPKYVKLYQNKRLDELPPHIFAIADAAYHTMLRDRCNQCIVISGESGSGKTESTNFLLHHLTALSQKGTHGSGVEQTILSAGPVLEAFGNAKTAHNNNSSRFGKFIQVNYKENGMVQGAAVHKYLLEKSRIVSQAKQERNYHVFYYLLAGASAEEKAHLSLGEAKDYYYLNQSDCYTLEGVDESYEFQRLKQSMEMVGFSTEKQKRLFCVLSALLHLGNVEFMKKSTYHHDEAVWVKNPQLVQLISQLLRVKEETLMSALTCKRAKASGETLVINYKLPEAIAARDALAKCLYGALFDWIVLQVNHALLAKNNNLKDYQGNSIGVLDIFGFEDFGWTNSFEQFCINFANEHLQFYFNQHVFKYEQEEYKREGIRWKNIDFIDNTDCLRLIEGKPNGLLCIVDDQCNFPGATNETLLQKFHNEHKDNEFYGVPQKRENAFIINHYAGKVKYQIKDFREKNLDLMRPDIVSVLKNSSMAFVRELVGADPVAVFRWAILRAFFRAYFAFVQAGQKCRTAEGGGDRGLKKAFLMQSRKQDKVMSPTKSSNRKSSVTWKSNDLHDVTGLNQRDEMSNENHRVNCRNALVVDYTMFDSRSGATQHLNMKEARALQRANRIIHKNKSFRPRSRNTKSLKNLMSVKTLACRTQIGGCPGLNRGARKQPLTVSAQFQNSLSQLMETLNQANPFFVRCIKSNADKISNKFDEEIILRQLRYTGMLETVRIRQSGYNVRLSFEAGKQDKRHGVIRKRVMSSKNVVDKQLESSEFIQHYRILLQKGLLSSQTDVRDFLLKMNLDRENYQIGKTKVFLRESEKLKLDYRLHQAILARIVTIQRWYRTVLERRAFLKLRYAITRIQAHIRRHLVQKIVGSLRIQHYAAVVIQKYWRGYVVRTRFQQLKRGVTFLQNCVRGYKAREMFHQLLQQRQKRVKQNDAAENQSQSDEAFMSKESSQEELENDHLYVKMSSRELRDSEESSGIQEDSEFDVAVGEPATVLIPPESPAVNVSTYKSIQQKEVMQTEKLEKPEERKTKLRKKLSLKRSKSEKLSTVDVSPAIPKRTDKVSKVRVSPDLDRVPPISRDSRESSSSRLDECKISDNTSSKGAFQKAKKHLKTFMGVGKKRNSHEDSEDSGSEEASGFSFHSSFDSVKSPDTEYRSFVEKEKISTTHHFKTTNKFSRGELCAYCEKGMSSLFAQGYRCTDCRQAFHAKCVQLAHKRACQVSPTQRSPSSRLRARRATLTRTDLPLPSWNVTRMSEFTDRSDHIISDVNELQNMDAFISKKICQIIEEHRDSHKNDTIVDIVFNKALKEFKSNLISTYSVAAQEGRVAVRYKDLISNFEQVMENVCRQECMSAAFPVTMGVNAFRGFLNEFMNQQNQQRAEEKTKPKSKKEKRRKDQVVAYHLGHSFNAVVLNIPTMCEICSSFIWLVEKGLVCQNCKLTCHRKCCNRITNSCKDEQAFNNPEGKVFGASLKGLLTEDTKIPLVVDRLITIIELKGLYTEGLYRKPGASSKVRMLKSAIEKDPESVNFDHFAIHVLTSTLKSFFREMNEPLMTFDAYDDFIRATDISDIQECISTLFSIINKLPKPNFDLLERLIFHLTRVAQHEEFNRMSPNALAIVFAPCILGTNRNLNAQDSLNDVNKQTVCIEFIIKEQLKKLKMTLADIDTIDTACHTATNRLSSIRSSKPKKSLPSESECASAESADYEDLLLSQHIETLQNEKVLLTTVLPTLARSSSDDEMLSTDVESTVGSLDDINRPQYEEYALTFEIPATPSALQHLTKNRATNPQERRPPTRFAIVNSKGLDFGDENKMKNEADMSIVSTELVYKDDAIMV